MRRFVSQAKQRQRRSKTSLLPWLGFKAKGRRVPLLFTKTMLRVVYRNGLRVLYKTVEKFSSISSICIAVNSCILILLLLLWYSSLSWRKVTELNLSCLTWKTGLNFLLSTERDDYFQGLFVLNRILEEEKKKHAWFVSRKQMKMGKSDIRFQAESAFRCI